MNPDLMLSEIIRRCPNIDLDVAYRLSEVWFKIHSRIVGRMFAICEQEVGKSLHIDQRSEAVFELVKLNFFMQGRMLDEKAKIKPLDKYDPAAEAALLDSPGEQKKIENTARNMADGVWKPLMAEWRRRRPLIEAPGQHGRRPKLLKPNKTEFRRQMHYVPQSTTRQWACGKTGKFTAYTVGFDGEIRAEATTAKAWGAAPFLYSQKLEHLLGLIEGDARRPYERLVNVIPLDEMDTRRWIAFLIAQLVRSPRFIRTILPQLNAWIERSGTSYPTDPAHLGRAFETLFENDKLYAAYYRLITARAWIVARAADGLTFLKGDNPVVINGSVVAGTWRLLYPLTPKRCFIAGPELGDPQERIGSSPDVAGNFGGGGRL